ncbi:abortive phage infection protein [Streptomyces sp. NPDC003077]|uniref:abortive phage infection protein n=1 Tax=Streptomyces sp. NPDC003077 TaxID=3154443 RepID=UPI0033BCDF3E
MGTEGIKRKQFLAGAAAVGVTAATGSFLTAGRAEAAGRGGVAGRDDETGRPAGAGAGHRRGLTYRGVCYEATAGETPGTGWTLARMRADIGAIKDRLHANSVSIYGTGVERLTATAAEAAERGLHVWLQPRMGDRPHREILDHLAETGRYAERLRRQGARVHLSVGCEFFLFVPGIVPGKDVLERIDNLLKGTFDRELMARRLRAFIARSAAVGRSVFRGPLTYGGAHGDDVDWNLFDIVSVNYYGYHPRRADYVRELEGYRRWGKPVAISEFGTCAYKGAPKRGGMAWNVIDRSKPEPEIVGNLVRSERVQAAYLTDMLDVFESMDLYAALVFSFVDRESPHIPENPRRDLDMATYSIVKVIRDRHDDPPSLWHWEPKQAFHALARHYARRGRC